MGDRGRFGISLLVSIGVIAVLAGTPTAASVTLANTLPAGLSVADFSAWHGHGDLAFVSRGRLLVLDGTNNAMRVLSSSVAVDTSVQFSPNAEWLLYESARGAAWLSRSDGANPRKLSGSGTAAWLPDVQLLLGNSIYGVDDDGTLHRERAAPANLESWSPDGSEYVFESDTLKVDYPHSSTGIERLETATSLGGKRTLWYEERESFTKKTGVHGNFLGVQAVLPHGSGLVVLDDVDDSDEADGRPLDVIRRPGGHLSPLTTVLAADAGGTVGQSASGELLIGAGGDRYAWANKAVLVCSPTATGCSSLVAPSGTSTLDPDWSPDGSRLAVVEASIEPDGNIGQPVVSSWYQTHRLAVVEAGAKSPTTIPGTTGAATPMWANDGKSLLYVANGGLWLVPADGSHPPAEIVAPLFAPGAWPSYYGEVNWIDQFAWNQGVSPLTAN